MMRFLRLQQLVSVFTFSIFLFALQGLTVNFLWIPNSSNNPTPVTIPTESPLLIGFTLDGSPLRTQITTNTARIATTNCNTQSEIPPVECNALLDLYNTTDGPNWSDSPGNGWNENDTPCAWTGVTCTGGHVTDLNRGAQNLVGILPATLGDLSNLRHLYLFSNQLSGIIPPELGNLINLGVLLLNSNQLSGNIPPELGNMRYLEDLYLDSNQLSGNIPPELGNFSGWGSVLRLQDNQLSGYIPPELENLSHLFWLDLSNNRLSGNIPPVLGNLSNLEYLWLGQNQLSGSIPPELGNLSNLRVLNLGYNALSATDPSLLAFLNIKDPNWADTQTVAPTVENAVAVSGNAIQVNWQPITYTQDGGYYQVYYSETAGGVYIKASSTTTDKHTDNYTVSGLSPGTSYYFVVQSYTPSHANNQNAITSTFSNEVNEVNEITQGTGTDCDTQNDLPPVECNALLDLYNATDGPNWSDSPGNGWNENDTPCAWTGVTCTSGHVTDLNRAEQNLVGILPATLGNLSNLEYLWLRQNQLTGSIPPELGNLSNMNLLRMQSNQLSGGIPPELGNLSHLYWLDLSNNQLSGSIPPKLGDLNNLLSLYLYSNQLSGSIPPELGNLNNLSALYLYLNQLSGSIPTELGNLSNLQYLNLGYNALSATDPSLLAFLNIKDPNWADTQTVAPTVENAVVVSGNAIQVNWQPITYTQNGGYYQVYYSETAGGVYTKALSTTIDKYVDNYTVSGLSPGIPYYFVVQSYTPPGPPGYWYNQNAITSTFSNEVNAVIPLNYTYLPMVLKN